MTLSIANAYRTAMCAVLAGGLDAGAGAGHLEIRSGVRPATPDTAATGTLLVDVTLKDTAFGAAASGAAALIDPDAVAAIADGVASWFRALDSDDNPVLDGSVTATGGGGDLTLATTTISAGLIVDIAGGMVTVPASDATDAMPSNRTLYSFDPPAGLTAVVAGGSSSQVATLQDHIDHVDQQWGGGIVDVSGGDVQIHCGGATGLVLPDGVALHSDEKTELYFPDLTTGAAITVDGHHDFTPLVGVRLRGLHTQWESYSSTSPTGTGIKISGIGLNFEKLRLRNFGKLIDPASDNTYILKFLGGSAGNGGVGLWADQEAGSLTEFGESIVFENFTFYNTPLGARATGNGLDLHFIGGSFDYCGEVAQVVNAWVYFANMHLEIAGIETPAHLLDVRFNSHVHMVNTEIIMGGKTHLFNPDFGPSNYNYGAARFSNVTIFYVDPDGNGVTHHSAHMITWPATTTSTTLHVPWPLRWTTVAADFVASDADALPNGDKMYVSAINTATGAITVAAPADAAHRWARLAFGS